MGREYADALLEGMGDIYSGDFTPAYSVLVKTVDVHLVEFDYEDDALVGDDALADMMRECEALNLTVGDASVGEIPPVLNHIDSDITDRLGVNGCASGRNRKKGRRSIVTLRRPYLRAVCYLQVAPFCHCKPRTSSSLKPRERRPLPPRIQLSPWGEVVAGALVASFCHDADDAYGCVG